MGWMSKAINFSNARELVEKKIKSILCDGGFDLYSVTPIDHSDNVSSFNVLFAVGKELHQITIKNSLIIVPRREQGIFYLNDRRNQITYNDGNEDFILENDAKFWQFIAREIAHDYERDIY